MANIIPIGCTISNDYESMGFKDISDIKNIKNVEDCITSAEKSNYYCDGKCEYVVYNDGTIYDLLRNADNEYNKSLQFSTNNEKQKYIKNSLELFKNIWLYFSPEERQQQINGNFLYGYGRFITENNEYMTFFKNNLTSERKPLDMKNMCWIGGKNVINSDDIKLINGDKQNHKCKYGLYIIPNAEADTYNDRLHKYYSDIQLQHNNKIKESNQEVVKAQAMINLMNETSNVDIGNLFKTAYDKLNDTEKDMATKDLRYVIDNNIKQLDEKDKYVKMLHSLQNTSKQAINKNIDLVKDKQHVADKIDSDLQILNWSLEESKNKEILQNKITSTLGIIIILFSTICVILMVYYIILPMKDKSSVSDLFSSSNKSFDKKSLNSLFT